MTQQFYIIKTTKNFESQVKSKSKKIFIYFFKDF
jgi:hypothetical protein